MKKEIFNWKNYKTNPPKQEPVEVLGFNKKWIDEDFNPSGTRVGFMVEDGFISAKWVDYQDTYVNDYQEPELWCELPKVK